MTLSLPPSYVPLPVEIIEQAYKPDKPHKDLFFSFVRLLALAWQNKYERTPRLREEELYNTKNPNGSIKFGYLKVSRREYFNQKREMELVGWLRSSRPEIGFVQFIFSRAVPVAPDLSAESSTDVHETALSELRGGGDSLNLNLNTDSPPPLKSDLSAQKCTFPSVVEILRHTDKLFDGSLVASKDLEKCSPFDVLGWCTYAYSNKRKLDGPGGLVRARLLKGQDPPLWTTEQWPEVLPNDFLEALGLITYQCDVCEAKFKKCADLEAHRENHPALYACPVCGMTFAEQIDLDSHFDEEHTLKAMHADESVRTPIYGQVDAEQAWQSVLRQLEMEMPRASFDTWVRDSKAVRYDGNALTLSVGVRNAYARDWLESRIRSTAERLLVGILARRVTVAFVVATVEAET